MSNWLMETIESLGEKQQKCDEMFNVLQIVLVLLLMIRRLDLLKHDNYFVNALDYKHYKILFQGLCMIPNWKSDKSWPDLLSAKEIFDCHKNKEHIVYVLTWMHRKALHFKQIVPEVLVSVPIFHFAKGTWEPFKDANNLLSFGATLTGPFDYFKSITTKW